MDVIKKKQSFFTFTVKKSVENYILVLEFSFYVYFFPAILDFYISIINFIFSCLSPSMSRKKKEGRRKNIKKIKSIQPLTFQQYKGQH